MRDSPGPTYPEHLLLDCFPLGDEEVAAARPGVRDSPLSPGAAHLQEAVAQVRAGDDALLVRMRMTALSDRGLRSDELELLYAARLVERGDAAKAKELALAVLPYATSSRRRLTMTHLIRAQAAAQLGEWREAADGCDAALQLADSPRTHGLRVAALCLCARVAARGDPRVAEARARRAVTLARTPRWAFHAHATLAAIVARSSPYRAVEHARLARHYAPSLADAEALGPSEAAAFRALREPPQADPAMPPADAHVHLSDPPHLVVGTQRYSLTRSPVLAVLIAYLTAHPGARLAEIAEQVLPDEGNGPGRVRHDDEAHRVARIRQLVQRVRALVGDPLVVVSRNGRLRLGPGYRWSSDLIAIGRDPATLPRSVDCSWLESLREDAELSPNPQHHVPPG